MTREPVVQSFPQPDPDPRLVGKVVKRRPSKSRVTAGHSYSVRPGSQYDLPPATSVRPGSQYD